MDRIRKILNIDQVYERGLTGKNIGIAIIDTGIYPHSDLVSHLVDFTDLVNKKEEPYDDNGHGTHVAGIIGGNGKKSSGLYRGVAPNSNLIGIKCLDKYGNGKVKNVLKGFEYIRNHQAKYNIRIVNISVGSVNHPMDAENEMLISETERLWKLGLIVVAAAGNNGPKSGTITAPGCAKNIITVGVSDDKYQKYSGRGPTAKCIVKPEIICPGTGVISCNHKNFYQKRSGTSMAVPIVSGIIALMLEQQPTLTNKEVKRLLHDTAKDLGYDKRKQGWGEIQVKELFEKIK